MHCQLYFQSKAVARLDTSCKAGGRRRIQLGVNSFSGRSNTQQQGVTLSNTASLQRLATWPFSLTNCVLHSVHHKIAKLGYASYISFAIFFNAVFQILLRCLFFLRKKTILPGICVNLVLFPTIYQGEAALGGKVWILSARVSPCHASSVSETISASSDLFPISP